MIYTLTLNKAIYQFSKGMYFNSFGEELSKKAINLLDTPDMKIYHYKASTIKARLTVDIEPDDEIGTIHLDITSNQKKTAKGIKKELEKILKDY
jgi:hypothetical protein